MNTRSLDKITLIFHATRRTISKDIRAAIAQTIAAWTWAEYRRAVREGRSHET